MFSKKRNSTHPHLHNLSLRESLFFSPTYYLTSIYLRYLHNPSPKLFMYIPTATPLFCSFLSCPDRIISSLFFFFFGGVNPFKTGCNIYKLTTLTPLTPAHPVPLYFSIVEFEKWSLSINYIYSLIFIYNYN